jgi:hypothetical protein
VRNACPIPRLHLLPADLAIHRTLIAQGGFPVCDFIYSATMRAFVGYRHLTLHRPDQNPGTQKTANNQGRNDLLLHCCIQFRLLQQCTQQKIIRQSTADDLSLYQPLFTPARAGSTCKFMRVLQSSLDLAEVSPARSRVHDHEFFQDADRPTKKCRDYWSAAPADGTLAAHCRTNGNSALPFKRQLSTKYLASRGRAIKNDAQL